MSTLDEIKQIITQIVQEKETHKPDLYCSEYIFTELKKSSDCQTHPTQSNTIVMLPNVYWTCDQTLGEYNIVAYTRKGLLIMEYLKLVSQLIFDEQGSMEEVQQIIKSILHKQH